MKKANPSHKSATKYLFALVFYTALSALPAHGNMSYFSDNFENGLARWDTDGYTFQVTDLFYHSTGHSASESPEGDYPRHANSTMTMKLKYRIDLSSSAKPALMFWHRIGVQDGDYGYVEVSQDNGFNWTELISFTNTHRSTWSREQVDLSAYRSSPILVRFRLRDNGDPWMSWGWDIDDVEICDLDNTTLPFPLFDDFESGPDNWKFGGWQPTESSYRSRSCSMVDSNDADYPRNACSDLILAHPIKLSNSVLPVLFFWHRIGIQSGDYAYVEISQDNGFTWGPIDPNHPERGTFTNLWYSTWTPELFDLSAYMSSPIMIRFRLRDNGDPWVSWGWDIDDVMIKGLIAIDPSPLKVQITDINTSNCPEIQATVIVTDMNDEAVNDLDASNFSVYEDMILQTPITVETSTSSVCVSQALDYSGSMEPNDIVELEIAATAFVEFYIPGDRGEIIKFAKGVEVVQEYTDDVKALLGAITRATTLDRSATSLYDAIYQAVSHTAEQLGSKAVIVVSDGSDTNSQQSATEVIKLALGAGVPVFTIGLGDEIDEDVLEMIADRTGGKYYHAPGPEDLADIYQKIAGSLNTQYLVTYDTTICGQDGNNDVEHELNIEAYQGVAYGQGTRRFHCPVVCNQDTFSGNGFDD